jgi:hypothetical protein
MLRSRKACIVSATSLVLQKFLQHGLSALLKLADQQLAGVNQFVHRIREIHDALLLGHWGNQQRCAQDYLIREVNLRFSHAGRALIQKSLRF